MATLADHNLLVLLIILGVAAGVLICWALFHFFWDSAEQTRSMTNEQRDYMREVKMRNVQDLAAMMGRRHISQDLDGRLHHSG